MRATVSFAMLSATRVDASASNRGALVPLKITHLKVLMDGDAPGLEAGALATTMDIVVG